ncbi:hypothetical protein ABTP08_19890, partial [Acinetobacter baumannii]
MTDAEGKVASRTNDKPQPEVEVENSFRLRPDRARVSRLSRKALVGGTAVALTFISGAIFWALQTGQRRAPASDDSYSTDHHNVADQLS